MLNVAQVCSWPPRVPRPRRAACHAQQEPTRLLGPPHALCACQGSTSGFQVPALASRVPQECTWRRWVPLRRRAARAARVVRTHLRRMEYATRALQDSTLLALASLHALRAPRATPGVCQVRMSARAVRSGFTRRLLVQPRAPPVPRVISTCTRPHPLVARTACRVSTRQPQGPRAALHALLASM